MGEDRKDQCLDWLLVRGRRHLERVLRAYVSHYNRGRPHRGLRLATPERSETAPSAPVNPTQCHCLRPRGGGRRPVHGLGATHGSVH
ncbi:MAG: integrase core domain-containing protein [Actinomycetota bacterium]